MKSKYSIECWIFHSILKKYLLLRCPATKRHPEYWQPVTGGVLWKETFIQACLREVLEETGIILDASEPMTVLKEYHVWVPEYRLEVRKPIFTTKTLVTQVKISDEHLRYRWTAPDEMKSFLYWESNKATFEAVENFYRQH